MSVYVLKKRKKYHREDCVHTSHIVYKALLEELTIKQAINLGYSACGVCMKNEEAEIKRT